MNLVDCPGSWIPGTSGRGHSAKSTDGGWHRTEGHYGDKNPDIYSASDNLGANPGHGTARLSPPQAKLANKDNFRAE